jgi:hypothetical protein
MYARRTSPPAVPAPSAATQASSRRRSAACTAGPRSTRSTTNGDAFVVTNDPAGSAIDSRAKGAATGVPAGTALPGAAPPSIASFFAVATMGRD